jgi:hypothetical protein
MKKVLLFIGVVFAATFTHAQISKGSVLLGTDFSFIAQKVDDSLTHYKQSNFSFSPSLGYAFKQNTILGVQVITTIQTSKYQSNPTSGLNSFGGGVFIRRYMPLGKAFYLFGQADAFGTHASTKQSDASYTYITKESRYGLSVYPGATFAVTRHFQIEAALADLIGLQYRKYSNETKLNNSTINFSKQNSFFASSTLSGNTSFTLGFRFLL